MLRAYPRAPSRVLYTEYSRARQPYAAAVAERPYSVAAGRHERLRENTSSRSSGVSADIRSTHSAEK